MTQQIYRCTKRQNWVSGRCFIIAFFFACQNISSKLEKHLKCIIGKKIGLSKARAVVRNYFVVVAYKQSNCISSSQYGFFCLIFKTNLTRTTFLGCWCSEYNLWFICCYTNQKTEANRLKRQTLTDTLHFLNYQVARLIGRFHISANRLTIPQTNPLSDRIAADVILPPPPIPPNLRLNNSTGPWLIGP